MINGNMRQMMLASLKRRLMDEPEWRCDENQLADWLVLDIFGIDMEDHFNRNKVKEILFSPEFRADLVIAGIEFYWHELPMPEGYENG